MSQPLLLAMVIVRRFVAGVIPREKVAMFERMLWRVSRGNAFLRQHDIDAELKDPITVSVGDTWQ